MRRPVSIFDRLRRLPKGRRSAELDRQLAIARLCAQFVDAQEARIESCSAAQREFGRTDDGLSF